MKLLLQLVAAIAATERIRGVSITKQALYKATPGGKFACLDGKATIPYDQVNDDFCDCGDGSDEPGTAACSNGVFNCPNAGFKTQNIYSSRVNDMICDCCDGSDEWAGYVDCPNTCKEEYMKAHADRLEAQKAQTEGFRKRQALVDQAVDQKLKDAEELLAAEPEIAQLTSAKDDAETLKNQAEEVEDKINDELDAIKHQKFMDRASAYSDEVLAEIAFNHLDSNSNGEIVVYEITSQKYLDPNPDTSSFTTKEAKEVMKEKDKLFLDDFKGEIWADVKEKIIPKLERAMNQYDRKLLEEANAANEPGEPEETEEIEPEDVPEPPNVPLHHDDDLDALDAFEDEEEDYEENYDDFNDDEYNYDDYDPPTDPIIPDSVEVVDPEHQKVFDAAKAARKVFTEAKEKLTEAESKISDIRDRSEQDFGIDDVFRSMFKVCFEYITTEYIYTLCPYSKCEQKPKNGGSGTKLGSWKGFENNHSEMSFTGGIKCWNGPDRSARIKLSCGSENKILSVDEPNRCEYEYKFETPAVCTKPEPIGEHDEL